MAKTAFNRSLDITAQRSSSKPSASLVDDHEIRELTIPSVRADRQRSAAVVAIVIVLTGIAAGVSAMLLGLLLHYIQHLAFTPSLTLGALLGTVLGYLWNLVFPSVPIAAFAIVGAAAFLASSMNMPLTAIALTIEFTRVGYDFWVPIFLAVAASVASLHACARRETQRRIWRWLRGEARPSDMIPSYAGR